LAYRIRSGRSSLRVAGAAGGNSGRWVAHIADMFKNSIGELSTRASEHRYGKEYEFKADQEGSLILYDVGYDAAAISEYVVRLPSDPHADRSTHPEPAERQQALA